MKIIGKRVSFQIDGYGEELFGVVVSRPQANMIYVQTHVGRSAEEGEEAIIAPHEITGLEEG